MDESKGSMESKKWVYEPMEYKGSLDHLEFFEVTPIIGREYTKAKISDILYAENAEEQIRDLAVIINQRGVCFFRAPQDDVSVEEQKRFTNLLGKLSGRPKENGLAARPLADNPDSDFSGIDQAM